jgi:hypothetical protein
MLRGSACEIMLVDGTAERATALAHSLLHCECERAMSISAIRSRFVVGVAQTHWSVRRG